VAAGQTVCWLQTRESHAALRGAEMLARQARDDAERQEAARALEMARRGLVRVPLKAPRAGVVLRRGVEPGTLAAESAEILAVAPEDEVVFEARVPATLMARLRPGQPAAITSTGDVPRTATLERVLPAAGEGDQAVLVWLAPSPRRGVGSVLDRFGTATLRLGASRWAPAVPDSAVVEDDVTGRKRVAHVGRDGRAVWVPVVLGAQAGGWSELKSPALPVGTPVLVEGQHGLPDSTRVKSLP
jgi:multidrug efflux pump subunit AcrA (membrane-fusion protein)